MLKRTRRLQMSVSLDFNAQPRLKYALVRVGGGKFDGTDCVVDWKQFSE